VRKLYLSFAAVLKRVGQIGLTDPELAEALFYLDSSRQGVFEPSQERERAIEFTTGRPADGVQSLLQVAEAEGRLRFRERLLCNNWHDLNELLRANGYATLEIGVGRASTTYCGQAVTAHVQEAGMDLEVVYEVAAPS
jgi:hypothetical protein